MKKLNKRKIRWIVREVERRETGVYTIARTQDITPRHARRVAKKYRNNKYPTLKKCGRKPRVISDEERKLVKNTYEEYLVGATMIEQILDEKGIHLNHNRIHRIMLETGIAKKEPNKSRRRSWVRYERKHSNSLRSWVRYERKHSNSLWHADWFQHKGKDCLLIIDDASRVLPFCKEYPDAKIDRSCSGFEEAVKNWGIPKQFMTDHGSNFVTIEVEGMKKGDSQLTKLLKSYGVNISKQELNILNQMERQKEPSVQ